MELSGPAKLNEELLDELREAFAIYDINGDGKITTRELCTVMRQLGQNPTEAEILDMIKELDTDCSGSIGFDEFTLLMADKMNKVDTEEDVLAAFRVFDANGNGFITAVELRQVVENLGEKLTAEETNEMIKAIDTDSDGFINYEDFKNLMIPK